MRAMLLPLAVGGAALAASASAEAALAAVLRPVPSAGALVQEVRMFPDEWRRAHWGRYGDYDDEWKERWRHDAGARHRGPRRR